MCICLIGILSLKSRQEHTHYCLCTSAPSLLLSLACKLSSLLSPVGYTACFGGRSFRGGGCLEPGPVSHHLLLFHQGVGLARSLAAVPPRLGLSLPPPVGGGILL